MLKTNKKHTYSIKEFKKSSQGIITKGINPAIKKLLALSQRNFSLELISLRLETEMPTNCIHFPLKNTHKPIS